MPLHVFLAWSGQQAKDVATALHVSLPRICTAFDPWMSPGIPKGAAWDEELFEHMQAAAAGIVCLTGSNLGAQWLLYETGMLTWTTRDEQKKRVLCCPYLFRVDPLRLGQTIFGRFQYVTAAENETENWSLVLTLYDRAQQQKEPNLPSLEMLREQFEHVWQAKLLPALRAIPDEPQEQENPRPGTDELLADLTGTVRVVASQVASILSSVEDRSRGEGLLRGLGILPTGLSSMRWSNTSPISGIGGPSLSDWATLQNSAIERARYEVKPDVAVQVEAPEQPAADSAERTAQRPSTPPQPAKGPKK